MRISEIFTVGYGRGHDCDDDWYRRYSDHCDWDHKRRDHCDRHHECWDHCD